ncbi:MAG: hypothetical protein CL535_19420 [Ahrensia sp.]|nr:hypothetical protein [Ahrensia sp.]
MLWLAVLGEFFLCQNLLMLQLGDALLISSDHRLIARFDNAVEQGIDLLFDVGDTGAQRLRALRSLCKARIPCVLEHGLYKLEQAL